VILLITELGELTTQHLASLAPHSGDWLLALPIANCGLRLYDEAVRVSMRIGLSLCVPHSCPCGEQVDAQGLHGIFTIRTTPDGMNSSAH